MIVELIHPPHANSTDDRLDPPLGLLLIASYLKKYQPDVFVYVTDLSGLSPKDWNIGFADVYGVTVYAPSLTISKEIIKRCKEKNPKAIIVVGGAMPSAMPQLFDVDHVVIGEGEQPMKLLIEALKRKASYPKVGICVTNTPFLFPAYELIDFRSYHRTINKVKSLPYLSSRGCPYRCSFCGLNQMHEISRVRFAEPEVVYEHLKRIKEMGIGAVNFQDDIFTMKRDRLFKILDLIKPLDLKFRCHGRAGLDDERVYEKLAEAGCVMVSWGIESGSQWMLDRMNKQVTVMENFQVIQWAKKYGLTSRAFFVIGFPGETKETLDETRRFIAHSQPDQYFVSNFIPYPKTDVAQNPKKHGITEMSENFDDYYQVCEDGTGGLTIDTEWLSRSQFRELELELRQWLKENMEMKGDILDYEQTLYKKPEIGRK